MMKEVCWSSGKEESDGAGHKANELLPSQETAAGSLAVLQNVTPGQGYYPGSYEYKYSLPKWHKVMNTIYQNAAGTRGQAENYRAETNWIATKIAEKIDRNQADVSHVLRERFQDVTYWKVELERTIEDLNTELESLNQQKNRLERLLRTSEIPAQINLECTHARDRRQIPERVDDKVDKTLYKELVLIRSIQDLMRKMIAETNDQIRRMRSCKEQCEFDWGDKWESANIEDINCKLNNTSKDIIMRYGAPIPLPSMASAEQWADYTRNLISNVENERSASVRLRTILDGVLADSTRELRDTADEVDTNLDSRIGEMEESLQKVEHHRDKTLQEISQTEKLIADIKKMLVNLESPLKVNVTRMDNRKYRNGIEMCRDWAHIRLLDEHQDLLDSTETMRGRLTAARDHLDSLERMRMDLEKEISIKYKSLSIDRNKCKFARNKYPAYSTLLGYQQ